jgi:putative sigma-54 modulation protein
MRFTFTEKKADFSEELRKYAEKKIGRVDRLFRQESDAFVTFSIERGRHIAEVTLKNNGMLYRASESTGDMYASIDAASDALERQIRKNKTRLEKRLREGPLEFGAASAEDAAEETDYDLVRVKKFNFKPMSTEEAILQMNLLGHDFFAFRNQEQDGAFAIVYKRKNGGYGMIESD